MPIDTTAAAVSDNYCDQLQSLVSLKLQALLDEYQPPDVQWNEAVENIDVLLGNLLIEVEALEDVETVFQDIGDAIDGKSNEVRDEALKFLGRYDANTISADVDPVGLYLKGRFEKARRDVEKYTVSRDEAEEALWSAINGLHAKLKLAQQNSTAVESGLEEPALLPALPAADAPNHPLDMEWFEPQAPADAVRPRTPTPTPTDDGVDIVLVGSLHAESPLQDKSPAP